MTLTEANHAVFINEWWGPSANAQARDRVVRLGQERVVHVHRFRCKGTIEEVLDQILARKSEAFANIVDALASGAHLSEMESTELLMRCWERLIQLVQVGCSIMSALRLER